ncbi:MAG: class I SAM-dependent methyltransferase [Jatrophihabitans sp.]
MPSPNAEVLPLTGERTVPGIAEENYWFRRHEAAYEFTLPYVTGKCVLEVGCGEGYGADLLASSADVVVGVDYDCVTIVHAARAYPGVRFARANLAALPVADRSVDVLATLQVIEHVWNHPEFVGECLRVLRPDGVLLVTTPNRLTFSPALGAPVNPFHTVEFTGTELAALLAQCGFRVERMLGLHTGARLAALDSAHGGSFVAAQLGDAPQNWSPALRADVGSVTTADFEVLEHPLRDVDDSLDLVLLARPRA